VLIVLYDAQERITFWQAQDLCHAPHRPLRLLPISFLPGGAGGGAIGAIGTIGASCGKGNHVMWGHFLFTFTFT